MPLLSGILGLFLTSSVWASTTPVLQICAAEQCVDANQVATPTTLFQRVGELFTKNAGRKVTFCDADPAIHLCFQQKLKLSASSNIMMADISVDTADMLEVKVSQDETSLTAMLDMAVEANGTYPSCENAQAKVVVGSDDRVSIVVDNFGCLFTSTLKSDLNIGFAVDYIDFEKAVMGGYYTFSASQAMHGMRSGYALLRFAEPVSAQFELEQTSAVVSEAQPEIAEIQVQPENNNEASLDCAPCVAEKIRDDAAVRAAIEAAARAEAEAKAAAERAVKMAEEAAQTTSEYAQKKAEEAEKAKQEAEKAAQLALAARGRVDSKVAAMSCQNESKKDGTPDLQSSETSKDKVDETQLAATKTVVTKTTVVKHIDADGRVVEQVVSEPDLAETQEEISVVVEPIVEKKVELTQKVNVQSEETFADKWNRWMNKASKVFWLEEPLF